MRFLPSSVACALVAAVLSASPAHARPSDDCSGDGTQDVAYIRWSFADHLVVQQTPVDASTSWICVHAGLWGTNLLGNVGMGGKLVVTGIGLTPTIDADVSACPQSSDVVAGQLGDPSNPSTYVPYRVATTFASSTLTVCVVLGPTRLRMTYPVVTGVPTVNFEPDPDTSPTPPAPEDGTIPAGSASSFCSGGSDVSYQWWNTLVWYSVIGGTQGFVQTSGNNVCYRTITPGTASGGRVAYTAGTYDIWLPAGMASSSSCTTTLHATTAPVETSVRTGSAGAETYLCASAGGTTAAVVARGDARAPQVMTPPGITHTQDQ